MKWISSAIVFIVFLSACQTSRAPEKNKILEVSFSGRYTAWLITRSKDLIQLSSDGSAKKHEIFAGKAMQVFFLNEKEGWVVDVDGQVWSLTEPGNWELVGKVESPPTVSNASNLVFFDSDNGWMTTSTLLWKTGNGGETWFRISPSFSERAKFSGVNSFFPKDSVSGWLTFSPESVSYTADNGESWQFEHFGGESDVLSITCRPMKTCLVGTGGGGLFSIDWENRRKPERIGGDFGEYGIKSISFSTDQVVWIAGLRFSKSVEETATGVIFRSEDEGKTWERREPPESNDGFERIHFIDEANGWLVSKDSVFATSNGGEEWKKVITLK